MKIFLRWLIASTLLLCAIASAADGDTYPLRSVTLVVPYPAGGIVDVRAREMAEIASRLTGQRFIVDNRPGATGTIGAAYAAKAKPDGYTVLVGSISELAVLPAFGRELPFDAERDLVPVSQYTRGLMLLVAHPNLGVGSVQDLVALARKRPSPLLYGTAGAGAVTDFPAQLMRVHYGAQVERVGYKSGSQALLDLIPGRLHFGFDFVATSIEHVRAGRLKPLMVTSRKRVPLLPDVPTAREAGYPELEIQTWGGFFVPRGTPPGVVRQLNALLQKVMEQPELQKSFAMAGSEVSGGPPEEFARFYADERRRWVEIVKKTGVTQE